MVLEIISTIAFAISGALVAIEKKMDVFGVATLGLVTAIGGGVLRDLILGITPPTSFIKPNNAIISIVTSIIIFLPVIRKNITKKEKTNELIMLITDSIGLGLFTVIGIKTSFDAGFSHNLFLSIFVGIITGVGGGVIRDIMAGNKPFIFIKYIYATASLIGAILCVILWKYTTEAVAMIISGILIFALRMLAAHFRWNLPSA
jgi:uncharacterized membrane protein YeiH